MATVQSVQRLDALGDRLAELGLTPGAPVRVLRRAAWGGPLLVQVRDYLLSLRRTEAESIVVVPAGPQRA